MQRCVLCRSRRELSSEDLLFTCKNRLRYSQERALQSLACRGYWDTGILATHPPPDHSQHGARSSPPRAFLRSPAHRGAAAAFPASKGAAEGPFEGPLRRPRSCKLARKMLANLNSCAWFFRSFFSTCFVVLFFCPDRSF